jgi:DHA1 family multidrug resistance protein-like MFS transporter
VTEYAAEAESTDDKENIWSNGIILLLCAGEILLMMGLTFLVPILPKFIATLGVQEKAIGTAMGLAVTAFGTARVLMDIPAGKISKHLGRRLLLVGSPLVVFISAIGCCLTTSYWQLIIWRIMQGAGTAGYSVTALIVLAELSKPSNRGLYISFFWAAALIGTSLGPSFGGLMGEYLGFNAVFISYALAALLTGIAVFLRIPAETTAAWSYAHSTTKAKSSSNFIYNKNFILACLVALLTLITVGGTQTTLIPLVGYELLSISSSQVGIGLTIIAVMQFCLTPFAGSISDKVGRKKLIVPGGIIAALGLVMFAHSMSYWFFILSSVILGLGRGIGGPVPTAYVADLAFKDDYESTLAAFRAISDLGWVIGPLGCGYLKDLYGLALPFHITAGMLFVIVILFGMIAKETIIEKKDKYVSENC